MTRDEVMEMTDDELRIKAAELKGAKWYVLTLENEENQERHLCWQRPTKNWRDATEDDPIFPGYLSIIPDYPNDIAAAWKLWQFAKSLDDEEWHGRTLSMAEFVTWNADQDRADWDDDPMYCLRHVINNMTAKAITRAFILAMEPA